MLEEWFQGWDWQMINEGGIPPHSYLIEVKGEPVAFSSFYKFVDVPAGYMGVTITDPKNKKAGAYLKYLWDFLWKEAKDAGINYLMYATDSKVVTKRFIRDHGWNVSHGGRETEFLVKNIKGDSYFLDE